MASNRLVLVLSACFILTSCTDVNPKPSVAALQSPTHPAVTRASSLGASGPSLAGIFHLTRPYESGGPGDPDRSDTSLAAQLLIQICEVRPAGCELVHSMDWEAKPPEAVRLFGTEYHSAWKSQDANPASQYRMVVRVAGLKIVELPIVPQGTVQISFSIDDNPVVRARSLHDAGKIAPDVAAVLVNEFGLQVNGIWDVLWNDYRLQDINFDEMPGPPRPHVPQPPTLPDPAWPLVDVMKAVLDPPVNATYDDAAIEASTSIDSATAQYLTNQQIVDGLIQATQVVPGETPSTPPASISPITISQLISILREDLKVTTPEVQYQLLLNAQNADGTFPFSQATLQLKFIDLFGSCGVLRPGDRLNQGDTLTSCKGRLLLAMQADGDFKLYETGSTSLMTSHSLLWSANTYGKGVTAIMQANGNLVVYDASGEQVWASNTANNPGAFLNVQDDGNMVIYTATDGRELWKSDTFQHDIEPVCFSPEALALRQSGSPLSPGFCLFCKIRPPSFVVRRGTRLFLDGMPFRFAGANMYWLGIDDSAPDQSHYPSEFRQRDALVEAKNMGWTVIRSKTLGTSVGASWTFEFARGQFNDNALAAADKAIALAGQLGLRLIIPLTDNRRDNTFGSRYTFTDWRGSSDPNDFYTHDELIGDFTEYVMRLLDHVNSVTGIAYKDDPTILAWELGNELENETGDVTRDPVRLVIPWMDIMSTAIKAHDPNHLIVSGPAGTHSAAELALPNVDLYSTHFYDGVFGGAFTVDNIIHAVAPVAAAGKAFFIGEYDWTPGGSTDLANTLRYVTNDFLISGDLFWQTWSHADDHGWSPPGGTGDPLNLTTPGETDEMQRKSSAFREHAYQIRGLETPAWPGPPAPTNIVINPFSSIDPSSEVTVTWRGSAGAAAYSVEVGEQDGPWQTVCDRCANDSGTSFVVVGAPGGCRNPPCETPPPQYLRVIPFACDGTPGEPSTPVPMPSPTP